MGSWFIIRNRNLVNTATDSYVIKNDFQYRLSFLRPYTKIFGILAVTQGVPNKMVNIFVQTTLQNASGMISTVFSFEFHKKINIDLGNELTPKRSQAVKPMAIIH